MPMILKTKIARGAELLQVQLYKLKAQFPLKATLLARYTGLSHTEPYDLNRLAIWRRLQSAKINNAVLFWMTFVTISILTRSLAPLLIGIALPTLLPFAIRPLLPGIRSVLNLEISLPSLLHRVREFCETGAWVGVVAWLGIAILSSPLAVLAFTALAIASPLLIDKALGTELFPWLVNKSCDLALWPLRGIHAWALKPTPEHDPAAVPPYFPPAGPTPRAAHSRPYDPPLRARTRDSSRLEDRSEALPRETAPSQLAPR